MNRVHSLNALTALLALRENLSEEASRQFITEFFTLIEKSLGNGTPVTIKGFGTFEVINGEVKFTADEDFAELVNEPFGMFSPVPLENDVELSSLQENTEEEQEDTTTVNEEKPEVALSEPVIVGEIKNERTTSGPPPFCRERFNSQAGEFSVPTPPELPKVTGDSSVEEEEEKMTEVEIKVEFEEETEVVAVPQEATALKAEEEIQREPEHGKRCCTALWIILAFLTGVTTGLLIHRFLLT